MMPLSFLDFFAEWDAVNWALFVALVIAFLAYYFWPDNIGKAAAEVSIDAETRKKANPLIALASDAEQELFTLIPLPLEIRAGERAAAPDADREEIRQALWAQQRAMITRLEGELDYAQQADISDHFAIAAPANQPASLLEKTLKDLESTLLQVRKLLKLDEKRELWHGRALILMLSNRKLFDHVAWLTGTTVAASAPGSFTQCKDRVVTIAIYATRLGGFAQPLTLQVSRATLCACGGNQTPKWLEYGLAYWVTEQILGKSTLAQGEQEPAWDEKNSPAIFIHDEWEKAAENSTRLDQLVIWSTLYVRQVMADKADAFLTALPKLYGNPAEAPAILAQFQPTTES